MTNIPKTSKNVVVHCKACKKELIYNNNSAVHDGIITLESRTYCEECLPKLFENDASKMLSL